LIVHRLVSMLLLTAGGSAACAETAADRGFEERASFAAMLHANKSTGAAEDRTSETVKLIVLSTASLELTRNTSRTFHVDLTSAPVVARLHLHLWHQGTDDPPRVEVNGRTAANLQPLWPSLSHRNYVVFLFDEDPATTQSNVQIDYQGWVPATAMVDGKHFKSGRNEITISVGSDQVKIRGLTLEVLTRLDTFDTLYNFATPEPGKKPPLLWDGFGAF
jgi:hypothetical protein